jgi:hypothetical protein
MPASRTFRYSRSAKGKDLAVAVCAGGIPGVIGWSVLRYRLGEEIGIWHLLAAITLLAIPVAWLIGRWRWGSWVRVDELTLSNGREARGPVQSVAWSDVSSVAMQDASTALYANGRWMTLTGDCDDLPGLRREILERAGPFVLPCLESDIAAGGMARFRGGEQKAKVAVGAALAGVAALVILGYGARVTLEMRRRDPEGHLWVASLAAAAGAAVLVAICLHLRGSGWRFGGVGVAKDGLLIKGWGKARRVLWAELDGADFDGRGRLVLRVRSGPPIRVPNTLGNFLFLEPLIRTRLRS